MPKPMIDKHEGRDKRLRSLEREYDRLWRENYKAEYEELPKPVFYAYKIQYVLANRDSRHDKAYAFIIDTANSYSRTRSIEAARKLNPPRIELERSSYEKVVRNYPEATRWFLRERKKDRWGNPRTVYLFNKTDFLVKKISKLYITHRRLIKPDILSRMEEISQIIHDNADNSGRLNKIHGMKVRDRDWDFNLYRYKMKEMEVDLDY